MEPTADNQEDPHYDPEEDRTEGNWKIIDLPEMKLPTGEEDEEELYSCRVKLYRWNDKQWKERATGDYKF